MTKDEVLKLALEALETLMIERGSIYDQAITAIKESLANEALEKMAENARELGLDYEPEPVAWAHHSTFENLNSFERSRYSATLAKKQTDACCIPLYTTQPQRTWVGLTDKEILADDVLRYHFGLNGGAGPVSKSGRKIVDALEAKIKEKNT